MRRLSIKRYSHPELTGGLELLGIGYLPSCWRTAFVASRTMQVQVYTCVCIYDGDFGMLKGLP
jgi:hypothetical protein